MHKIINKKSIQKITAIIIIMIMCNFIMSGKVWAVESWMSIKEYQDLSIGGTDTKQDLYNKDTSPAVKKLCSAWYITAEQAIEMLKNHANDEKTLYVNKETYDNTAYTISDVKIKPTEEEKTKYIELISKLDALSPLKTLTRGYSIVETDNKIIKSSKQLSAGDKIKLRFSDGQKNAEIL